MRSSSKYRNKAGTLEHRFLLTSLFPLGTKGLKSQNLSENSLYGSMNPLDYRKYGTLESGFKKCIVFKSQNITLTLLKEKYIITSGFIVLYATSDISMWFKGFMEIIP